jgi:WD40 repeat protein
MSEGGNGNSIQFSDRGLLIGHTNWVTGIVAGNQKKDEEDTRMLVSCSRDRSIIVWRLNLEAKEGDQHFGQPQKQLVGHDHFVNDVCLSSKPIPAF